ncbi:hypothetical protein [uncultured Mailhella sp.]|uniref:hypothetical protein n=1 Tax=uncultured Mailhella sp. TaxID=1981031 RepID=UPI0026274B93|nr:hypothetical protein [uncultured Mailhella sp.]
MDWDMLAVWLVMGVLGLLVGLCVLWLVLYFLFGVLKALIYLFMWSGYVYYAACTCADYFRLRKWRPEWKARERKEWEKSPEARKRQELLDSLKDIREFLSIPIP